MVFFNVQPDPNGELEFLVSDDGGRYYPNHMCCFLGLDYLAENPIPQASDGEAINDISEC